MRGRRDGVFANARGTAQRQELLSDEGHINAPLLGAAREDLREQFGALSCNNIAAPGGGGRPLSPRLRLTRTRHGRDSSALCIRSRNPFSRHALYTDYFPALLPPRINEFSHPEAPFFSVKSHVLGTTFSEKVL